jgi:hypothetical protein
VCPDGKRTWSVVRKDINIHKGSQFKEGQYQLIILWLSHVRFIKVPYIHTSCCLHYTDAFGCLYCHRMFYDQLHLPPLPAVATWASRLYVPRYPW